MNVGPLADIRDDALFEIHKAAVDGYLKSNPGADVSDDMWMLARLCMAATGGHLAVDDDFFYHCFYQVRKMLPKHQSRWKSRVDDAKGTHRNVVYRDNMLRVRDDMGRMVPIVPTAITATINRGDCRALDWVLNELPEFRRRKIRNAAMHMPLPEIRPVGTPRYKHAHMQNKACLPGK